MLEDLKVWFRPWYNKYAVLALCAAAGLGAYEWIHWGDLSASDWGTWVGAIGTIATLTGTIYLATAETRRRERQERVIAKLHVEANIPRLMHAGQTIGFVCKHLVRAKHLGSFSGHLKTCKESLSAIYPWKMEELIPLAPLPMEIALTLAQGLGDLQSGMHMIDAALITYERTNAEPSLESIYVIYPTLVSAGVKINAACHMCLGTPCDMSASAAQQIKEMFSGHDEVSEEQARS